MKSRPRRAGGNDAFLLWLACVAALCAGYYLAFGVIGSAIELEHEQTAGVWATGLADAQLLAERPILDRQRRMIEARLNALALHADKPTTVARFIHVAAQIATAQRVDLVEIDERPAGASPAPALAGAGQLAAPDPLEAIPLDVTLRGSYRALLAAICALAQAPVTMRIEIAAIERDSTPAGNAANGRLTARLRIDLQRLVQTPMPLARPAHV